MSERQFVKKVRGNQCDICGKEITGHQINSEWQHLMNEGIGTKDKTAAITFRWFRKNPKVTYPREHFIKYDFHAECFAKNIEKVFPKANKQLKEIAK